MNARVASCLLLVGLFLMVAGAIDPLEGSVLMVAGHLLALLGVKFGGHPQARHVRMVVLPPLIAMAGVVSLLLWRSWHQVPFAPLVLLGLLLCAVLFLEWGLRRGAPSDARCVAISAGLSVVGVAALWVLSSFGGFGENALSWWWSLLILPFPVGWLRGLYSLGRWIGEGKDAAP